MAQRGQDRLQCLEMIYQKNLGLIHQIAQPLVRPGIELDDLLQEAYFAILKAVDQYDEQQGSFVNYAGLWLKWWLLRYIENNGNVIRIPVHQQERIRQYKRLCSSFESDFGRLPTAAELSSALELSPAQVEAVKADALFLTTGSLDAPVEGLEEDSSIISTIPDDENGIDDLIDEVQREQLAVKLWAVVAKLSERDQYILRARYKEGKTLKQCADELGKSKSTIATQEKQAFRKIRKSEDAPVLRSFLDEKLEASAYHHNSLTTFRETGVSGPEWSVLKMMGKNDPE